MSLLKLARELRVAADELEGKLAEEDNVPEEKVETLVREYRKKLNRLSGAEELGKLLVLLDKELYRKNSLVLINKIDKAPAKQIDVDDFVKRLKPLLKSKAKSQMSSIMLLKKILNYAVANGKAKTILLLKTKARLKDLV